MTLNSLCGISLNATAVFIADELGEIFDSSQFPLWDFFECNLPFTFLWLLFWGRCLVSQFPLWDFFECNKDLEGRLSDAVEYYSQFPLWDFFECNWTEGMLLHFIEEGFSQFPLWDFFECNLGLGQRWTR